MTCNVRYLGAGGATIICKKEDVWRYSYRIANVPWLVKKGSVCGMHKKQIERMPGAMFQRKEREG